MFIDSLILSFLFLFIALILFCYSLIQKILYIKSSPINKSRFTLLKETNNPILWREKKKFLSYTALFWAITSTICFLYLYFLEINPLISLKYIVIFIIVIIISTLFVLSKIKKKNSF